MKRMLSLIGVVILSATLAHAATTVHIVGPEAMQLVSLLASGSDEIYDSLVVSGNKEIVTQDLEVSKQSTYKYDPPSSIFNLAIYHAEAQVGSAQKLSSIREATSLWTFLEAHKFKSDLGLGAAQIGIATIDCKIDVKLDIKDPKRFQCDIVSRY